MARCSPRGHRALFLSFSVTFLMVKKMFFWRLLIPLSQTIGTLFLGSLVCCDKTGCRTHFYATTDATRCPALMPGILVDPLAAYSIVRRREPRRSAETFAANPRNGGPKHFQTDFAFFPPLSKMFCSGDWFNTVFIIPTVFHSLKNL